MSGETEGRNVIMEESKVGSQNSDDTLVVLEFSPKAPAETKEWLTALIKAPGEFQIILLSFFSSYRSNPFLPGCSI